MIAWVQFKTENGQEYYERLFREFSNKLDPRGRAIAMEQGRWMLDEYGVAMTITCIGRTPAENTAAGGKDYSTHLDIPEREWIYGWDFRSRELPVAARRKVCSRMTGVWNNKQRYFIHVIHHDSGAGKHFHANINRAYR